MTKNDMDPDAMLQKLEETTDNFRYNRSTVLNQIVQKLEEEDRDSRAEEIRYEAAAFMLTDRGDAFSGYFQPMVVFEDGGTVPAYEFFSADVLKYLKKRAKEAKTPIISARFADVVWDFKKDIEMARLAIESYIKAAEIYRKNLWGVEYGQAIRRAAQLSSMINDSKFNKKTKDFVYDQLISLDEDDDYRFCIDIAEAIANSKIQLEEDEQEKVKKVLLNGADYYKNEHVERDESLGPTKGPNSHLSQSLYDALIELSKTNKIDDVDINSTRASIAETLETEGDEAREDEKALASIVFYFDAQEIYDSIGQLGDRDRILRKLKKAGVKSKGQIKEYSVEIEIEEEKISSYISPFLEQDTEFALKNLARSAHFIPSVKDSEERSEKLKEEYPAQALVPRIELDDELVKNISRTEDERKRSRLIGQLINECLVGNIFLTRLFDELKSEYDLQADDLIDHFESWGFCSQKNIKLLKAGFEKFDKGDYIGSIHILVLQFEDILRNLLREAGEVVSDPNRGVYYSLKDLLDNNRFGTSAGEDLINYYKVVLTGIGLNIRNKIAHGLINPESMDKKTAARIIHILLTLTRFYVKDD